MPHRRCDGVAFNATIAIPAMRCRNITPLTFISNQSRRLVYFENLLIVKSKKSAIAKIL